ncbi:unnamed protein product [Periconia digitata]|uniref:Uncharacterized protein n=1 Tax=Periconia digitata TaxID=1303443 RepID=A0A9W4UQT1_9PLEO|nr:unnamed protein product [Periconia digitata]
MPPEQECIMFKKSTPRTSPTRIKRIRDFSSHYSKQSSSCSNKKVHNPRPAPKCQAGWTLVSSSKILFPAFVQKY